MAKSIHRHPSRRAYVNPLPGYSEAEQRADILKCGPIAEWYVESRSVKRDDFIQHLRVGDTAVVARIACLAKAAGRIDARMNDLQEARGDIHAKGCIIKDALGDQSVGNWLASKEKARAFLLRERNIKNGSAKTIQPTNAEVKAYCRIMESRRYKNDNQRMAAIKAEGLPKRGRTWLREKLPIIARDRGLDS